MRPSYALLAVAALLAGCGGSHHSTVASKAKGRGTATLRVSWPAVASRLIPNATNSLVVVVKNGTATVKTATIARPAAGTTTTSTTLTGLPYGDLAVTVNAYPTATGTGTIQATGVDVLHIVEDVPGAVSVALDSTVTSLAIAPASPKLAAGSALGLFVSAKDATGALVLLAVGAAKEPVVWSSDAPGVASVSTDASNVTTLSGVADGTANLTATMVVKDDPAATGATLTATTVATVGSALPPRLASGGYPRTGGDLGNSGQGGGNVAGGTVGWNASVGAAAVRTIVVGPDGTIYAASGGTVAAFDAAGAPKWTSSATVTGTVTGLALSNDGKLYVGATGFTALDAATGATAWGFATVGTCYAPNVLPNGLIVQATTSNVVAIDPTTHASVWQTAFASSGPAAIAADGTIVVWNAGEVRGLEGTMGTQTFSKTKVATVGPPITGPYVVSDGFVAAPCVVGTTLVYGEVVFSGSVTRRGGLGGTALYSGTKTSYRRLVTTGGTVTSSTLASVTVTNSTTLPTLVGPSSFSEDATGRFVYGYPTKVDGSAGWTLALTGSAGASIGSDSTVYVATTSAAGLVRAVSPSGSVLWTATLPAAGTGFRPAVGADGTVYAGTTTGKLVQIR